MSNTFKHKKKGFVNALEKEVGVRNWPQRHTHEDPINTEYKRNYNEAEYWWDDVYGYNLYNSAPGWWCNLMMERPARRKTKNLCKKVVLAELEEAEEIMFPLAKKPHDYYW